MATIVWDGGPTGDGTEWSDAANWVGDVLPGPSDEAILGPTGSNPEIRIFNTAASVGRVESQRALRISNTLTLEDEAGAPSEFGGQVTLLGTLTGDASLRITGAFTWNGGTMSGTGETVVPAGELLTITPPGTNGQSVVLSRTLRIEEGARVEWTVPVGLCEWRFNGGTLINEGTLTFTNTGGGQSVVNGGGVNAVRNLGTIVKVGSSSSSINVPATNEGTVRVVSTGRRLILGGGGGSLHTGDFVVEVGAELRVGGSHAFGSSAQVWGGGLFRVTSAPGGTTVVHDGAVRGLGTLQFDGSSTTTFRHRVTAAALTIDGGTVHFNGGASIGQGLSTITFGAVLGGNGDVEFEGRLEWNAGVMAPGARTIMRPGAVLVPFQSQATLSRTLIIQSGATGLWETQTSSWIFNGGTLINEGVFTSAPLASQNTHRFLNQGGINAIMNRGTFIRAGRDFTTTTVAPGVLFENQGSLIVRNGSLSLQGTVRNTGTISIEERASLHTVEALPVDAPGSLAIAPGATLSSDQGLTGTTTDAGWYRPLGETRFRETGGRLEVMSRDAGPSASGFVRNFAYGLLRVGEFAGRRLTLEDAHDNAAGVGAEALYAAQIIVTAGCTLDLAGFRAFARSVQIAGSVVNGTITVLGDSGPLALGTPTPGALSQVGETDEWTLFGFAGRGLSVTLSTGGSTPPVPTPPPVQWGEVEIVSPSNAVVAVANNLAGGAESPVTIRALVLPETGVYRVRVRAPSAQPNATGGYVLVASEATLETRPLVLGQQHTGAIEAPDSIDRWVFTAAAGDQVRFALVGRSSPNLVFTLTGPNNFVAFTDLGQSSNPINLPEPGQYVLSARALNSATGQYTFRVVQTTLVTLTPGMAHQGTIAGTGQAQLFRIDLAEAGRPLYMALDDSSPDHRNELYLRFGAPPTRGEYDHRASAPDTADQSILVPGAYAGTWYAQVYATRAGSPSPFTIRASLSDIRLTSVSPSEHVAGGTAELTLRGAGFVEGTRAWLVDSAQMEHEATAVETDTPGQITATFDLAPLLKGTYSVRVRHPQGQSDTLPDAFTVSPSGRPRFEARLVLPDVLGRTTRGQMTLEYANTGTTAMRAPLLLLRSADPDGDERPILTLDVNAYVAGGVISTVMPDGCSDSIQMFAGGATPGVLAAGERVRVSVYYRGLLQPWNMSDGRVEMEVLTLDEDNTTPIDWESLREPMRPPSIDPEPWAVILHNLRASVGETWGQYVVAMSRNAASLQRSGAATTAVGDLWSFELREAIGQSPAGELVEALDLSLPAPGFDLSFSRVFIDAIESRYRLGILGRGWSTPYETRLAVDPDGSVNIFGPADSHRRFQADGRGGYIRAPFETGTLIDLGSGRYELREQGGAVLRFGSGGRLDRASDANGNTVTIGYDSGRLVSLTHSSGRSLLLAYNAFGRVESVTDSAGRVVTFAYDASGEHLLVATSFDGAPTTYTYNVGVGASREHALTSVLTGGVLERFEYDGRGRLSARELDGGGGRVTYVYAPGSLTVVDGAGAATTFSRNARGQLTRIVGPLGLIAHVEHGPDFRPTRVTDAAGQHRSFTWCDCGAVASVTDQLGNTTLFEHDPASGRLTAYVDANGNSTLYGLDPLGNLASVTYDDDSQARYAYDGVGNVISQTNRRGQVIRLVYDAFGQVTRREYQDGSHADYTYDARGNLLSASDPAGTTTYEYDAGDRLTRVNSPAGRSLSYTYDAGGRRVSMTDHTGFRVNYAYDAAGRLRRLTDGQGVLVVQYSYDALGRLARKDNGNGTYTLHTYDAAGQLLSIVNNHPGGGINSRFDYSYDALGRRTSVRTIDGLWTYTYDAAGQVVRAVLVSTNPNIPHQDLRYAYDAVGNRTRTIVNGVVTDYATNSLNQYTRVGSDILAYDADGNLVSRSGPSGEAAYSYDPQSRLVRAVTPAGVREYVYDATGQRVASTLNGVRTEHLLDPTGLASVVADYASSGSLIARYLHGFGLSTRIDGPTNERHVYDFDVLGGTASLTDGSGDAVNRYAYGPFGTILMQSGPVANEFTFVGQVGVGDDGSGLLYMRARAYSAGDGRFIQADPLGLAGADPNLYVYVRNQVTRFVDPEGLWALNIEFTGYVGYGGGGAIHTGSDGSVCISLETGFGAGGGFGASLSGSTPDSGTEIALEGSAGVGVVSCGTGVGLHEGDLIRPGLTCGTPLGLDDSNKQAKPKGKVSLEGKLVGRVIWCWRKPEQQAPQPPPPAAGNPVAEDDAQVVTSTDPNALYGPSGYGPLHYVRGDATLPYRIEFENYGPGSVEPNGTPAPPERWATAPAQRVEITNTLSADLDWGTFRLTSFGFGEFIIVVPGESRHFQTIINMTYNGLAFEVHLEAGINLATGTVFAIYQSLDPLTGLPPSVLYGFLPPEDGTGRGRGFVNYAIAPIPGLPSGRQIRNVALISFDSQIFIATNQVDPLNPGLGTDPDKEALVTIDGADPASGVEPLPPLTNTPGFIVRWSGDDDPGGSGLAFFTVYVSVDGGDFEPWIEHTTETQAKFAGEQQRTYAFYSVATDNTGRREAAPLAPDAQTVVSLPPVLDLFRINDGHAQRSMVNSLTITFDSRVVLLQDAFVLTPRTPQVDVHLVVSNPSGDGRTFLVTFTGTSVLAGSLADGIYDLRVVADRVRNEFSTPMAQDRVFVFHRLFGDGDGDADVDALDLARARRSLGTREGDPRYVWWLDFDQDRDIFTDDLLNVRGRLGVRLRY